jgi:hypothetical protein
LASSNRSTLKRRAVVKSQKPQKRPPRKNN